MIDLETATLLSFVSAKGGTGKTTTALCLSALLARETTLTLIECQDENPQHQHIVFPHDEPEEEEIGRHISLRTGRNSIFDPETYGQLSFISLKSYQPIYGKQPWVPEPVSWGGITGTVPVKTLREASEVRWNARNILAVAKHLDHPQHLFAFDYDAGIDEGTARAILPLHRAVEGYGLRQSVMEHLEWDMLSGKMDSEGAERIYRCLIKEDVEVATTEEWLKLRSIRESVGSSAQNSVVDPNPLYFDREEIRAWEHYRFGTVERKERFGAGHVVFVASPAVAEIRGIMQKSSIFRDLGSNNQYLLVVNQCREQDVAEIERMMREGLGDNYRFEAVFALPHIPYMEFGNVRAGGDPTQLPVYSGDPACVEYTEKLGRVAEHILRNAAPQHI